MILSELLAEVRALLHDHAPVEAELIVIEALRRGARSAALRPRLTRSEFILRLRDTATPEVIAESHEMARARAAGGILQHITGWQQFLDHDYEVNETTLVPRPETEVLVTEAILELRKNPPRLGIEIGIGTGCISVELMTAFPDLKMIATELSPEAAELARKNAERILGAKRALDLEIRLVTSAAEVTEGLGSDFRAQLVHADFMISNPPYLLESEATAEVLALEPRTALFAPAQDPLYFYRKCLEIGVKSLFLEIPHERANEIRKLAASYSGPQFGELRVTVIQDLAGRDRVLMVGNK